MHTNRRNRLSISIVSSLLLTSAFTLAAAPTQAASLELPWTCGESYRVTQAHNGGSHTGKGSWAWDFSMKEGHVVVAPADGIIRMVRDDSTRYGCGQEFAHDGNYVIVAFPDGTEALFLHMKAGSVRVAPGQSVRAGEPLAEVGNSGYVCGTHLHYQIQETCSSWWCPSIPAEFAGLGDPQRGATLTSQNCAGALPHVLPADGESVVVDERGEAYGRDAGEWYEAAHGEGGSHDFAFTGAEQSGHWVVQAAAASAYQVEAHIPAGAEAERALYVVRDGDTMLASFELDQSAREGWAVLGEVRLPEGREVHVELAANTGEPEGRRLVYDALRLTPMPEAPATEPGPGGPPVDEEPEGEEPEGEEPVDEEPEGEEPVDEEPVDEEPEGEAPAEGDEEEEAIEDWILPGSRGLDGSVGYNCSSAGAGGGGVANAGLIGLAVAWLMRCARRKSARAKVNAG